MYFYGGSDRINIVGEITSGSWNSEGIQIKNNIVTTPTITVDTIQKNSNSITLSEDGAVNIDTATLKANGKLEVSDAANFSSNVNISGNFVSGTDDSINTINGNTTIKNLISNNNTVTELTIGDKKFTTAVISESEDFDTWVS